MKGLFIVGMHAFHFTQAKTFLFIYLYFSVMKPELTCLKYIFMF